MSWKRILTILTCLCLTTISMAQTTISYTYDSAGNRAGRYFESEEVSTGYSYHQLDSLSTPSVHQDSEPLQSNIITQDTMTPEEKDYCDRSRQHVHVEVALALFRLKRQDDYCKSELD